MDIVTRQQLNVLIQMAKVDKNFAEVEEVLIHKIAGNYGFSEEEVQKMINNPEPIGSFGALSERKRFEYLYNLVNVMLVDEVVHPSERIFCQSMAIKLGYHKEIVDFLISQMQSDSNAAMGDLFDATEKYRF